MRRTIFLTALVATVLGSGTAISSEDDPISVVLQWTRGEPDRYGGDRLGLARKAPEGVAVPKEAEDPWFVSHSLGFGRELRAVFDPGPRPMRIWVDTDLDGDLGDERAIAFVGNGSSVSAEAALHLPAPDGAETVCIPLRFETLLWRSVPQLSMTVLAHLQADVVIEGRLRRVEVCDGNADLAFDRPLSDVWVLDLDGDGEVDRKDMSEWITAGLPFRVRNRGYRAELLLESPPRIIFHRTTAVPPSRARPWKCENLEKVGRKLIRKEERSPEEIAKLWQTAEADDRTWGPDSCYRRESAIRTILRAGSREAFRLLLRIAKTEKIADLRKAAVEGMGYEVYAPHADRVIELAKRARDPAVRRAAIEALNRMAATERLEAYGNVLDKEKVNEVAEAAARCLAFARSREAKQILAGILEKGKRKANRYHAYIALTRYTVKPPSVECIRSALDQTETRIRAVGLTDALFLRLPDCRELALECAKKATKCPHLSTAVVEVLGREGDVEAVEALLGLAESMPRAARKRAVRLLTAIRDPEVVTRLTEGLAATSPSRRTLVAMALGGIPLPGVADALADRLSRESDDDTLLALIRALAGHGSGAADRIVAAAGRIEKDPKRLAATLKALGRIGLGHERVRRFFDKFADSKSFETRILAIDAAAATEDAAAAPFLLDRLEDATWQVRLAAVQGLGLARSKDSVPVLIERLGEEEKGRIRSAIASTLFRITGQNFYEIQDLWRKWWKERGAKFEVPDSIPTLPPDHRGTGFYGVPVDSDRIIFVLDQSGSMGGSLATLLSGKDEKGDAKTDFERAVEETLSVVKTLDKEARVNVILFETTVRPWQRGLVKMTRAAKNALAKYLHSQEPTGTTNLYDALEMALKTKGVDTIYVLSDGSPTDGKFVEDEDILAAVEELNRTRRIAIHCISLGFDAGLLRTLAARNGGKYVRR